MSKYRRIRQIPLSFMKCKITLENNGQLPTAAKFQPGGPVLWDFPYLST